MSSIKGFLISIVLLFAFTALMAAEQPQQVTVRVDGLACPFCAYGMEKKLKRIEGVEKLDIKINEGLAILSFKEGAKIDKELIAKKIKEAGFTPKEITVGTSAPEPDVKPQKLVLKIEGMQCEGCVSQVESALKKVECASEVSVNLEKNEARLLCAGNEKDRHRVVEEINKLGFKAELVGYEGK